MDVKRKIAGLPAWGWGIGLGGGLILGFYLRSRRKVASEAVVTETPAPVAVGASPGYEALITEGAGLPGSPGFAGATGNFEGIISREFETYHRQFQEEVESSRGILKAEVEEVLKRAHEELVPAQPTPPSTSPIQIIVPEGSPPTIRGGGPPVPTIRTPRPPATPAPPPVVRNGVNIQLLEAALRYANDPRYRFPNHRRESLADLIRAHPDWGPMTIANCGKVRGHSTRA